MASLPSPPQDTHPSQASLYSHKRLVIHRFCCKGKTDQPNVRGGKHISPVFTRPHNLSAVPAHLSFLRICDGTSMWHKGATCMWKPPPPPLILGASCHKTCRLLPQHVTSSRQFLKRSTSPPLGCPPSHRIGAGSAHCAKHAGIGRCQQRQWPSCGMCEDDGKATLPVNQHRTKDVRGRTLLYKYIL